MSRLCFTLLAGLWLAGCADADKAQLHENIRAAYDKDTGKLAELAYDANQNGRTDTWTEMHGPRPVRSRIDRNEDGRIDRWEYFDADGQLVKVGFSRNDSGTPDAWAYENGDGTVTRIEISSAADEQRIDRWEHYDATPAGPGAPPRLSRAEEDTNHDGRPDKWETFENGAIRTVAFDENGDGVADRRLVYERGALLSIESEPDPAGRFARRVRAH